MNGLARIVHDIVTGAETFSPELLTLVSEQDQTALEEVLHLLEQPPAKLAALLRDGMAPIVWQIPPPSIDSCTSN